MNREIAINTAKELMISHELHDWKLRLSSNSRFLGLCDYKNKTIFLNQLAIDTQPEPEILNTIKHEIAHALVPIGHGHDEVWQEKAKLIGCDNTLTCGLSINPIAVDAIRSGHSVEVEWDEQLIRTPRYKVTRLIEKCSTCGKVAKEVKHTEKNGWKTTYLECGHFFQRKLPKATPFEDIISHDATEGCIHEWNLNRCTKCPAAKLFKFQVDGVRNIESSFGRHGLFDEQGLGKTVQSLAYLRYHPECFPVLLIVKSAIKYQWSSEIMRWVSPDIIPQIFGSGSEKAVKGPKAYIIGYDMLRRMKIEHKNELYEMVNTIIADECQAIKNPDSTRTIEVREAVKKVKYFIPLSGTPWKNRGSEYFPVLNMLDAVRFPSYAGFVNRWGDFYYDGTKYKEGGIRNVPEFREFIKDIVTRRERLEVDVEFPELSRVRFYTELDDAARTAYDEEVSDFVKMWNQVLISGEEDSFTNQANALAALNRMRHMLGLSKIPATMELVEEFIEDNDRKLVVFVHHKDVGEIIYRRCRAEFKDVLVLKLTGEMDASERYATQNIFNKTKKCILIASTLASGEGMNLQTCSDCIVHERQWNPANEEQVEGRFVRIGSTANKVIATYVHAQNSIDTKFDSIVERKRVAFHNAMNKGEQLTWNESGMVNELISSFYQR